MADFIISILRTTFFYLDSVVYGLIDDVYSLLMQIARTTIFDQDALNAFSRRIYALLGIFMLLKVMISIINYVLNPDDLVDKEKGFGAIFKRIILSLTMVVLVPYAFKEATTLQNIILQENTIMTIIFGTPGERGETHKSSNSSYYDTAGQKIQFTILFTFFQPNTKDFTGPSSYSTAEVDLNDCKQTYQLDDEYQYIMRERPSYGQTKDHKYSRYTYALNEKCYGKYNPDNDLFEGEGKLLKLFENHKLIDAYQNYAQGIAQQSYDLMFRKEIVKAADDDGRYFIDYKIGISTAVGVAVLYLFLLFCIDIAGRSIKLGFLQLISPIPILSYCDPASSKKMFKGWYEACFKAYLELFIRLFALYFGIYVISLIGTFKDVTTNEAIDNWLVSIFMIIGVLIFVKKLPELLKETLGLDLGGKFELNPLKKLENDMIFGKHIVGAGKRVTKGAIAGAGAGAAAMGTNLFKGAQNIHAEKGIKGKLKAGTKGLFSGLAGGISGSTRGLANGLSGKKLSESYSKSYGTAMENRQKRADRADDNVKWREMMANKAQRVVHFPTRGQKSDSISNALEAYKKNGESIKNNIYANDKAENSLDVNGLKFNGAKGLKEYIDALQAPVQGATEDITSFNERVQKFKEEQKKFQDALDARVAEISHNTSLLDDGKGGAAGGATAIASINELLKQMDAQRDAINKAADALYHDELGGKELIQTNHRDESMGMKNSLGAATGAQGFVTSHAAHDKDVDKYGEKKDAK